MAEILNLTLKKNVFEGLKNGTINEIIIEKSNWWKKRLMDVDTGRFKDFGVACISCGSADKLNYDISSLELRDNKFIITIIQEQYTETDEVSVEDSDFAPDDSDFSPEIKNGEDINPEVINPEVINPIVINKNYVKPITSITQNIILDKNGDIEVLEDDGIDSSTKSNIEEIVMNLFDKFCLLNDVYVVSMPKVTIRNNGQIFGCKKRLIADRDSDVMFDFIKKEFTQYAGTSNSAYILEIMAYMSKLLKNSYVFVNKNASGFRKSTYNEPIFTIYAISKKKYLFAK